MRFARILAISLAMVTFAITGYYLTKMPFAWLHLLPANIGVIMSLYFWRKSPKRKKARRMAAFASLMVVPFMAGSAALGLFTSPIKDWPVFLTLAALALIVAVIAATRVTRKQAHVWADYYSELS